MIDRVYWRFAEDYTIEIAGWPFFFFDGSAAARKRERETKVVAAS